MVPIFPYAKIKSEKIFHFILAKRPKSIQDLKKKKGIRILEFYKRDPLNAKKTVK